MGRRSPGRAVTSLLLAAGLGVGGLAAQQRESGAAGLPPLSHTCPHHPDVVESSPGTCPVCRMTLVPVRLAPAWSCPIHPATVRDDAGTCRICRRPLVPVTVSLTWACRNAREEHASPGACADGSARLLRRAPRPHGDHNPRHGGQFFMAPDNWHHVEGAYPQDGIFRLYVYDDYARPLPPDRLRRVQARLVLGERFDRAVRRMIELGSVRMRAAADGAYLEARLDTPALPLALIAKVRLPDGGPEHRFDFTFRSLSPDPALRSGSSTTTAAARSSRARRAAPTPADADGADGADGARAAGAAAPSVPILERSETGRVPAPPAREAADASDAVEPAAAPSGAPPSDPALVTLPIPDTMTGILEQLRHRDGHVRDLISRGDFAAVWVPAFQAKELAVALEAHLGHLDTAERGAVVAALGRIVRFAWLLDAYGDTGNRQQLEAAYAAFTESVDRVLEAFAP